MIKLRTGSNFYGEKTFFVNDETGDEFQRIVCGIGFPFGKSPGIAVILAETRTKEHGKKPHFYVLAEHENFNPTDLLRACVAFKGKYFVSQFYADTTNAPMMAFVYKLKVPLPITSPPFVDDPNALSSYIAQIRQCMTPGSKRLHFKGSTLTARFLEIPAEKIRRTSKVADWPAIAALGGGLSALLMWKHDPKEQRTADALNAELWAYND